MTKSNAQKPQHPSNRVITKKKGKATIPLTLLSAIIFGVVACVVYHFASSDLELAQRPISTPVPMFNVRNGRLTMNDKPITLRGVNWYGFESANMIPDGLYANSMETYFKFLAKHKFNAIRLPFSAEFAMHFDNPNARVGQSSKLVKPSYIKSDNDLVNKTPKEVLERFLGLARAYGMLVVPDLHQFFASHWDNYRVINGNFEHHNALWYYNKTDVTTALDVSNKNPRFDFETVVNLWVKMAAFFKRHPHVFAVDIKNEPRGLPGVDVQQTWKEWVKAAQVLGNAIHNVNENLIIFVEGLPGDRINWGGNMKGVKSVPVQLKRPNKVVYSPHVYGPDVAPGLTYTPKVWDEFFGFLIDGKNCIIIGEWGGFMNTKPGRGTGMQDYEANMRLANYIRAKNISAFYWALNPTSGDTGGLYLDDAWTQPATIKLDAIKLSVPNPTSFDLRRRSSTEL